VIVDHDPFWHCIVDDFFYEPHKIAAEFPAVDDPCWFRYDNPLEIKQTCNDWHKFGPNLYKTFSHLLSPEFTAFLESATETELTPDVGLHGGGLHQHGRGGKLNVHLDYNIHPKLHLQRRLNLIVYLTPDWQPEWGGGLGLYKDSRTLAKTIDPVFNRAVIFDTRGSWHGLPSPINCPEGVTRNSLAVYYLCEPEGITDNRSRALFAPTVDQEGDRRVLDLIRVRSS
jgi:hypothetical protein